MLARDIRMSVAQGGSTGGMTVDIQSTLVFSFMDMIDRAIMDVLIWFCRNIFRYDAEKTCRAILQEPNDSVRRNYIISKFNA
jgi:hypothetical protein